jgi:hypothetical protein
VEARKSTLGFAIFLGNNLVSWSSKKQPTVTCSSTEAEYRALANVTSKLTWLDYLLRELGFPTSTVPLLCCGSLSATYLTANPVFHSRTKHMEIDFYFAQEKVKNRALSVKYISTHD